jgi:hypothetical protein
VLTAPSVMLEIRPCMGRTCDSRQYVRRALYKVERGLRQLTIRADTTFAWWTAVTNVGPGRPPAVGTLDEVGDDDGVRVELSSPALLGAVPESGGEGLGFDELSAAGAAGAAEPPYRHHRVD